MIDNFISRCCIKKAPAAEDAGQYIFTDKGSNNSADNQTFDEFCEQEQQRMLAEDAQQCEWVTTPTASSAMASELAPVAADEEQHTAAPLDYDFTMIDNPQPIPGAELPIWGIPAFYQKYCENVTSTYQCPREFVLGAMFSAVSSAVGNRVRISTPKYKRKPMSLWVTTVAPSGSNKSEPVEEVMKPLTNINADLAKEYERRVSEIRSNGSDEPLPPLKRMTVGADITPEALKEALYNNPLGICQYEDEISTIFLNQNRYSQGAGVIDLLKVWDGRHVQQDRKSKDNPSFLVERSFLNILGNIQPEYIKDVFGEKRLLASGFVARWMFLFEEVADEPLNDAVCDPYMLERWESIIKSLQTIDDGQELLVDGEAYEIYRQYYAELQLKKKGKVSNERAIYAKLQIMVLRLAGIVHCMAVAADDKGEPLILDNLQVTANEMRYAVDCMAYFERTALQVMQILCPPNDGAERQKPTKKQLIKQMFASFAIPNKQAFADAIGVSRPYISGIINEK